MPSATRWHFIWSTAPIHEIQFCSQWFRSLFFQLTTLPVSDHVVKWAVNPEVFKPWAASKPETQDSELQLQKMLHTKRNRNFVVKIRPQKPLNLWPVELPPQEQLMLSFPHHRPYIPHLCPLLGPGPTLRALGTHWIKADSQSLPSLSLTLAAMVASWTFIISKQPDVSLKKGWNSCEFPRCIHDLSRGVGFFPL